MGARPRDTVTSGSVGPRADTGREHGGTTRRRRLVRWAVAFGVMAALATSMPSAAQDDPPAGVLLILDGSGSMNATDDTGRPLIDLAKEALASIVRVLPAGDVDVGLRVYGHRTPSTDEVVGCTDSELVVPVGPLEPDRMIEAIDAVDPSGFTPIGLSLSEAATDLAGHGTTTVILVSDGEDTCAPPDPCEVAAELAAQGITVNTVGFYLEAGSAARGQLECIAAATGGAYRDADDEADLAGVVGVFLRDVPGVGNFHIPFDGSTERATAPLVVMPRDEDFAALRTTISAGETRWFAVDVPEGHTVDLFGDARSFAEAAIPEPDDAVVLTIVDAEGRDVGVRGRFGLDRIDLGTFVGVGLDYLQTMNVDTARSVSPWSEFASEPQVYEGLEYLGYDQASWDAEQRLGQRYERRGPFPAGTYTIGVTWASALDATTTFDHLIGLHPEEPETFSRPAELTGSTDPTSPTRLADLPVYDAWPIADPELDPVHELYGEGPIAPNEARWFSIDVDWGDRLLVDALLAAPLGAPVPAEDELSIQIVDPLGRAATTPHPGGGAAAGAVGDLPTYFGQGFEPRPLVSAAARGPGTDTPPPGEYHIGVTWSSASPEQAPDATLEVRIGIAEPDGMIEMPPATTAAPVGSDGGDLDETAEAPPPSTSATSTSDGADVGTDPTTTVASGAGSDDGGVALPVLVAVAALLAGGAGVTAWLIRRRR